MLRPKTLLRTARPGHILLVTLAMLALLAVVGLTAVYYTKDQAERARIVGSPAPLVAMPDDGMGTANIALGTFLYDAQDTGQGLINSARGHSLAATMYGRVPGATIAWNGPGTFGNPTTSPSFGGLDRRYLLNLRLFAPPTGSPPGTAYVVCDPEYSGERDPNQPFAYAGNYYGKNPPYTYPDLKDFYLAYQCPLTGEILVPSFHRNDTTGVGAGFGSLAPGNANWTNVAGRFLTLRPRPQDHLSITTGLPIFPPVPANAPDPVTGAITYTGDVKNLEGAPGGNDSIWIDVGAPIVNGPDGKRYKPLVAPLILDMDGRLNLNVHGNVINSGIHASGSGVGPHEVSLEKALIGMLSNPTAVATARAEAQAIVNARGTAQTRSYAMPPQMPALPVQGKNYATRYPSTAQFPQYSAVPWIGFSAANSLQIPSFGSGNPFFTNPLYPPGNGYVVSNDPTMFSGHPGLYNSKEWPVSPGGWVGNTRSFPLSDTKLLAVRYAPLPAQTGQGTFALAAPNTLKGLYPLTDPNPPATGTQPGRVPATAVLPAPFPPNARASYRGDPAHANRHLFTSVSNSLDRTTLMPGAGLINDPYASTSPFLNIGPIDLNRTLTDYRDNPALPPSPANMDQTGNPLSNASRATAERQQFAYDIFARLIAVSGSALANSVSVTQNGVIVFGPPGTLPPPAPQVQPQPLDLQALRSLAQLAVNIVDYIDPDDVSTVFMWKQVIGAAPAEFVYGVEKPRLVINEAYAELVNDPMDPINGGMNTPQNPGHVRFWVELLNPGVTPYAGGTGPQGDGSAQLRYAGGYNPYVLEIARYRRDNGNDLGTYLANPANVTGRFDPAFPPEIAFDFSTGVVAGVNDKVSPNGGVYNPGGIPAQGIVLLGPTITTPKADEFDHSGGKSPPPAPWATMIVGNDPQGNANQFPQNQAMAYKTTLPPSSPYPVRSDLLRHVILLRRLANPYRLPNDPNSPGFNPALPPNPYITADMMDYVPAFDALHRGANDKNDRGQAGGMNANGYTPMGQRAALGKVQPYAGLSYGLPGGRGNYPRHVFPNSLVVDQTAAPGANMPMNTFGRHNGVTAAGPAGQTYVPQNAGPPPVLANLSGDTLMAPFDWLTHMDRPLVNSIELFQVTADKPHELTQHFMIPTGGGGINKFPATLRSYLLNPQPAVLPVPPLLPPTYTQPAFYQPPFNQPPPGNLPAYDQVYRQLYRALDLLRTQPYGQQTALGGKVPGKININTISDLRVWRALLDDQGFNSFSGAGLVDSWWYNPGAPASSLMPSRTTNFVQRTDMSGNTYYVPVPGPSVYDTGTQTGDRPFLPFGVSTVPLTPGARALAAGTGVDDTLLRRVQPQSVLPGAVQPGTPPLLSVPATGHPYQQDEAIRKITNSTTTVSNVFAVWLTVGYFEVEPGSEANVPANWPAGVPYQGVWGKEFYREAPGDSRHKFFFLVDRTNMGYQPSELGGTSFTQVSQPFFTTVEANRLATDPPPPPGTPPSLIIAAAPDPNNPSNPVVYTDGVPVNIVPNMQLIVGTGTNQEVLTVVSAAYSGNGLATVSFAAINKNHYAGENVANIVPGNPGPQPTFDVNSATYQAVVPLWARLP